MNSITHTKQGYEQRLHEIRQHYEHGGTADFDGKTQLDDLISVAADIPSRRMGHIGNGGLDDVNWHEFEKFLNDHDVKISYFKRWMPSSERWDQTITTYKDENDLEALKDLVSHAKPMSSQQWSREMGNLLYAEHEVEKYIQKKHSSPEDLIIREQKPFTSKATTWRGMADTLYAKYQGFSGNHPKIAFAGGTGLIALGANFVYSGTKGINSSSQTEAQSTEQTSHNSVAKNLIEIIGGLSQMTIGAMTIKTALKGHYAQFER